MMHRKCTGVRSWLLTTLATALVGPGAWGQTFKVLHSFGDTGDGRSPFQGQVFDSQGSLYGATYLGGPEGGCRSEGCGTVYQLKPNSDGTWTETVIHAFNGSDGAYPWSSLLLDSQGNLYGSAAGQVNDDDYPDCVYQLTPNSDGTWTESVLYQFPPGVPGLGSVPGELTFDASGNIFGATRFGGMYEAGTVYSLIRSSGWQERLLHTFRYEPVDGGSGPVGPLALDADGNLYGTTLGGGPHNAGTVFKLTNQGGVFWQETVLYNFTGGRDGSVPVGVILGPDGSLYGMTQVGGKLGYVYCQSGCGTVFQLTPSANGTWTKTTLYAFRGGPHDGAIPTTHVTFDRTGNIYGTTNGGGNGAVAGFAGYGTVFKLTPSSGGQWTESALYFFTGGLDGLVPDSPLVIGRDGNLYGTAGDGGMYGGGVAFEITP
jgi:uncharacterized repeat protein (TIGR03803 family)